ncbi:MAG: GntR family transcriptional regulator [Flavobacteriales bacterium]|nr:GntR family transcriptional regulator [Bacteroidota bacterium]MCB9241769.1 GntR family transcriptional regulator [Flavobacteriales bacterium]
MKIGRVNTLTAARPSTIGIYLIDEEGTEILLPNRYVSDDLKPGDELEVFVYTDSEDRPVAVTDRPILHCGQIGFLDVTSVGTIGAFLNWGLEKDLLLPYREQTRNLKPGDRVAVAVELDEQSNRPFASMRLNRFFQEPSDALQAGDQVDVSLTKPTDIGWNCIVNQSFEGLVYQNEIFQDVFPGLSVSGWISKVRDDGKLDIRLQPWGGKGMDVHAERLLKQLQDSPNGSLPVGDKSSPDEIIALTGMSKRNFKQAVGNLFKKKLIVPGPNQISLK